LINTNLLAQKTLPFSPYKNWDLPIENTSKMYGDEVVQLYIRDVKASVN